MVDVLCEVLIICSSMKESTVTQNLFLQGVVFEKISEDEMEERLTGRRSKGRWNRMAEKKRLAQELARRATESKYRKRMEQQGEYLSLLWIC